MFFDSTDWQAAVEEFQTIDFVGHPLYTIITDQYADLGVTFTDGNDFIVTGETWPNDGSGLDGNFGRITVIFDQPLTAIAMEFPGFAQIDLYRDGTFVGTTNALGGGGVGFFGGIVLDQPFDTAVIFDPVDPFVSIDDLHFGQAIPGPPTSAVLVAAWACARRRRRRPRP